VNVLRIHHVAFASGPADEPLGGHLDLLGLTCVHVEQGAGFVERMAPAGEGYLQLLEASGGRDVVSRFVERRGAALHHVAFEVDDIDGAIGELLAAGVRMIDAAPRPGGMGARIAFAHPSSFGGLLVELLEEGPSPTSSSS
jgi:methylmalonyl-CoA/ethylmalonyl-CoA epimerase